jgi:hypothetical protein
MGSLTSPKTARHHISPLNGARIYLHTGLHAYPRTTIAWAELPSCVTPSLTYYRIRPTTPPTHTSEETHMKLVDLSINGFSMGA